MRRLLRQKAVTIIAAIVSFTVISSAAIVATATPAPAVTFQFICNRAGHQDCLGAPTINSGDPVLLTANGREITEKDRHFTCCGGLEVYQLTFTADGTKCVGVADNSSNVEVRDCSGGDTNNTNWGQNLLDDGSTEWLSTTKKEYLASDNTLNHQLHVCLSCTSNDYFRWTN